MAITRVADGVYFARAYSHNGMVVEFPTFLAVVEAAYTDAQSHSLEHYAITGNPHVDPKVIAYVPNSRVLFQSDIFFPGAGLPASPDAVQEPPVRSRSRPAGSPICEKASLVAPRDPLIGTVLADSCIFVQKHAGTPVATMGDSDRGAPPWRPARKPLLKGAPLLTP
jgi:hypothetical protein